MYVGPFNFKMNYLSLVTSSALVVESCVGFCRPLFTQGYPRSQTLLDDTPSGLEGPQSSVLLRGLDIIQNTESPL